MATPYRIDYIGTAESPAVAAAIRRRLRSMEASYTAVQEWQVTLQEIDCAGDGASPFEAIMRARIVGGEVLQARARGNDALSAVRLAFLALELELEGEHEDARTRAAQWLESVKRRIRQREL